MAHCAIVVAAHNTQVVGPPHALHTHTPPRTARSEGAELSPPPNHVVVAHVACGWCVIAAACVMLRACTRPPRPPRPPRVAARRRAAFTSRASRSRCSSGVYGTVEWASAGSTVELAMAIADARASRTGSASAGVMGMLAVESVTIGRVAGRLYAIADAIAEATRTSVASAPTSTPCGTRVTCANCGALWCPFAISIARCCRSHLAASSPRRTRCLSSLCCNSVSAPRAAFCSSVESDMKGTSHGTCGFGRGGARDFGFGLHAAARRRTRIASMCATIATPVAMSSMTATTVVALAT